MKSHFSVVACIVVALCGCLSVSGCTGSASSGSGDLTADGAAFLLRDEPADAQGVVACRALLEESAEAADVVLVGRVGGLSQPTWEPDRAVFMVADLAFQKHEEQVDDAPHHDADSCPFCRAEKKQELAAMAMIELVDDHGSIPEVGAQKLLGLSEGQTVVIRGKANLDKLGVLVVRSSGLFIGHDGG